MVAKRKEEREGREWREESDVVAKRKERKEGGTW